MLYFTDFQGATSLLIPKDGESILYVYGVNYEGARAYAKNCKVELVERGQDALKKTAKEVERQKLRKLAFDTMTTQAHQKFKKTLKKTTKLKAKSEFVWKLRRTKEAGEIKNIREAARLTVEGMKTANETIRPGMREREIGAEIEYTMRKLGSYGVPFNTIVSSGPHSAFPHGGCGERKLKNGELVIVDIGATYKNYRADMSRTFTVGRASARQERLFSIVEKAQDAAFKKILEGTKASKVDATARDIIEEEGYGKSFPHGLGHGVGLDVHEKPVLNPTSKDVLEAGDVVTDEPGIYIVDFGGVRIEDTVLVKKDNPERLTKGLYFLEKS
jgi:Xaa-Pro aminopeptidase